MTQNEETIKNDGLETEMDPPEKKKGRPKKVNTEDTTESTLPENENQTDGISEQEEQVEGNQNTETAEDEHIVGLEEDIEDINDSEEDSVEDSAEDSVEDIEDGEQLMKLQKQLQLSSINDAFLQPIKKKKENSMEEKKK